LYGRPQPVVYGDSIIPGGDVSELSGTFPPAPYCQLDLIQNGYFGL
jgi:hypothetical protein